METHGRTGSSQNPPALQERGYVAASLQAALWAFSRSSTFGEGSLLAVNLGDGADTTGAYYGAAAIPRAWLDSLAMRDHIESYARGLIRCGVTGGITTPRSPAALPESRRGLW